MGKFTVGTAKLDITPGLGCHMSGYFDDRLATGINDPLYVKALAISDGEREIGLITLDNLYISRPVVEKAKELIQARTGVDSEHVLISVTHTHTGPGIIDLLGVPAEPGYAESLIPKITDAFVMAHNARVPAEIAHTSGDVHEEVHNRRWHMKDGSTVMNPGYMNPNAVCPAGPTDPQLGLLIARDPETKKPLALYANLALHYVGPMKIHTIISADYFEFFAYAMHRIAGTDFLVMMANGTQGNINNCDFTKPARTSRTNFQQAERVANVCAGEAWKAWNLLRDEDFKTEGFVDGKLSMVPFKARTPSSELIDESKKILAAREGHSKAEIIYANEIMTMLTMPTEFDIPVHSLCVNDLGITGLPGEVFVEFGLDLKGRSPFPQTMVVGLANDTVGYVATDKALDEGSYETRLCCHVRSPKGTGQKWVDTAVGDLSELKKREDNVSA